MIQLTFNLYGYKNIKNTGSAGFIKDFSLTTEITPELSTMLTVGATANSIVVGENSTAFSKFNAGLKDRYKEEIVYIDDDGKPISNIIIYNNITAEQQAKEKQLEDDLILWKSLRKKYNETYSSYIKYIKELSGERPIYNNDADTYKDALVNYITYEQQARQVFFKTKLDNGTMTQDIYDTLTGFLPSTGFIPFNMSLTMDGLSGMKIYSKFLINTDFLPSNYPKYADFLIKGVTHTIEGNKWSTKLESIVISQGQ